MADASSGLLIGLGPTGTRTAALVWRAWKRMHPDHLGKLQIITVGFDAAPSSLEEAGVGDRKSVV